MSCPGISVSPAGRSFRRKTLETLTPSAAAANNNNNNPHPSPPSPPSSFSDDKISKFRAAVAAFSRRRPRLQNPSSKTLELMTSFSRSGAADEVLRLFHSLKLSIRKPNVFFYNTLINSLIVAKRPFEAEAFFHEMISRGITPTNSSYSILLKLHFLLQNHIETIDSAYRIIYTMIRSGCNPDSITYSTLIAGLCRVGRIEEAWGVLDLMIAEKCLPTVRSYTSIVLGYCTEGRIKEAKRLVDTMESRGCPPDTVTYSILIDALCKVGDFGEVKRILGESGLKGWKPNEITYNIYMNGLCKVGKVDEAFRQLEVMREKGLCPTVETLNILFDCLCHDSKVWEAKCLLERSDELDWDVDVFFYNTLMSRLHEAGGRGGWMTVLKLLTDMVKKGIEPDACTFTIVIRSLCKAGKLCKAKCVISSKGFVADVVAFNTLLHGFYMAREFNEVRFLFSNMVMENVVPNKFTYSIMIDSLCREGKSLDAIDFFLRSLRDGFLPDLVARLIRWLVKDGKLREMLNLFEEMLGRSLILDVFIFNTLIRAFCKKGFCQSVESHKLFLILDKMLGIDKSSES